MDAADLDFGIFSAVMNHKRVEWARFIEGNMLDAIEGGLAVRFQPHKQEEAEAQYHEALRALEAEVSDESPVLDAAGNLTAAMIAAGGRTMRQLRQDFLDAKQARERHASPPIWKPKPTTTSTVSSPAITTTATSSHSGVTARRTSTPSPTTAKR